MRLLEPQAGGVVFGVKGCGEGTMERIERHACQPSGNPAARVVLASADGKSIQISPHRPHDQRGVGRQERGSRPRVQGLFDAGGSDLMGTQAEYQRSSRTGDSRP